MIARDRDVELKILEKVSATIARTIKRQIHLSGNNNFEKNSIIKYDQIENLSLNDLLKINISDDKKSTQIEALVKNYENQLGNISQKFENKIDKIQSGDELLPGVLKLIKVFI